MSLAEIDRICQEVTSILNKSAQKAAADACSEHLLKKAGQLLWDNLLTKPAKDRLKSTLIPDLILYIDEELIHIPWELLYDGQDFLCLKFNLGRLIITREQATPPQYRSSPATLKMLILANPTGDLKSAYQEGLEIKNQFDRKASKMNIDFKSTQINRLYLKKNLRDYDVVHFAGHCEYEADNPGNTGWALSDGRFTSQDIILMTQTLSLPTLVFSNACHSAQINHYFLEADYQKRAYTLASAFLFAGVRHYIGAIRRIEDQPSRLFAREFYGQLILSRSVGESMRLARLKLVKEYGITANLWTSYLLYGDPTFALFSVKLKPSPAKLKRSTLSYKRILTKISLAVVLIAACVYLYVWLPTINPNTLLLYRRSQKLFGQGKNQEVLMVVGNIIKADPGFLSAYPLLADTYQRLGKREEALKNYFAYAIYSEKKHDKKHLASAYIGIGWIYHLQGDHPRAYEFYNRALAIAKENKDSLNQARAMRKLAVWYIDNRDYDKALELLTKSSEINRQRQYSYEHRYNLACDYFDIGLVFANKNDYATAREFYTKSLVIFEKLKLKNELSDCYFNRGEVYLFEKEYHKALDNYLHGLRIDELQGNKSNIASDYNMIGELYVAMDNPVEAEKYFNLAVSLSRQINARPELAAAFHNLGLLYKQKGRKNKAKEYFRQAQEVYKSIDATSYEARAIKEELMGLDNY